MWSGFWKAPIALLQVWWNFCEQRKIIVHWLWKFSNKCNINTDSPETLSSYPFSLVLYKFKFSGRRVLWLSVERNYTLRNKEPGRNVVVSSADNVWQWQRIRWRWSGWWMQRDVWTAGGSTQHRTLQNSNKNEKREDNPARSCVYSFQVSETRW